MSCCVCFVMQKGKDSVLRVLSCVVKSEKTGVVQSVVIYAYKLTSNEDKGRTTMTSPFYSIPLALSPNADKLMKPLSPSTPSCPLSSLSLLGSFPSRSLPTHILPARPFLRNPLPPSSPFRRSFPRNRRSFHCCCTLTAHPSPFRWWFSNYL